MLRTLVRLLTVATGFGALVAAGALPASAHVVVTPGQAVQGSMTEIAFRMPTERDDTSVKLTVTFPEAHPLPYVLVKPHPDWSIRIRKVKLDTPIDVGGGRTVSEVVRSVTWSVRGRSHGVGPDQYDDFKVLAGYLPTIDRMYFKAVQTYADGTVIPWVEIPSDSDPKPAHPAPSLTLVPPSGTAAAPAAAVLKPGSTGRAATDEAAGPGASHGPLYAGAFGGALLLGAAGLGGRSLRGRRRPPQGPGARDAVS
ncbi:YcnI family protein [Spirillospora sp. NPDC047418]